MASIFTMIVKGDIPSYKILENDEFYAFLDINPLQKGHTLVIPKVEIDYLFDLDDNQLSRMMVFAKEVAKAIKLSIECKRVAVVVLGMEVPHAHIHLVPINKEGDIDFKAPKMKISKEDFIEIQNSITSKITL